MSQESALSPRKTLPGAGLMIGLLLHSACTGPAPAATGQDTIGRGGEADLLRLSHGARAHVPASCRPPGGACPLLVLLHGSGGYGQQMIDAVRTRPAADGIVLLAPTAAGPNWDAVDAFFDDYERGSPAGRTRWPTPELGRDSARLHGALDELLARTQIDRRRIGILGFSHGASYALTFGSANPQLFHAIIAVSPGILVLHREPAAGQHVYMSHGTRDRVLSYRRTHDSFRPRLASLGFRVTFRPFVGGHILPHAILDEGIEFFLSRGRTPSAVPARESNASRPSRPPD